MKGHREEVDKLALQIKVAGWEQSLNPVPAEMEQRQVGIQPREEGHGELGVKLYLLTLFSE